MEYGTFWQNCDEVWYQLIYGHLRKQHEAFIDWVKELQIKTVFEAGCGSALYSDVFYDKKYTGMDISQKAIYHAIRERSRQGHKFLVGDFIKSDIAEKYDLVFSHSVIDHVYDINTFLLKLYGMTKKYLWITCFNGWNNQIQNHQYEKHDGGYYINKISIPEIMRILDGLSDYYDIFPLEFGESKTATIIKVVKDG